MSCFVCSDDALMTNGMVALDDALEVERDLRPRLCSPGNWRDVGDVRTEHLRKRYKPVLPMRGS